MSELQPGTSLVLAVAISWRTEQEALVVYAVRFWATFWALLERVVSTTMVFVWSSQI